jgi:hypothetical protein
MDIRDEVDGFGAGCLLQLFYTRLAASLRRTLAKRGLMKAIESWEAQQSWQFAVGSQRENVFRMKFHNESGR